MTKVDLPKDPWSISIYTGESPLSLSPHPDIAHPALGRAQVNDVPASFIADPFFLHHGNAWHLFFEILNHDRGLGEIGYASSPDVLHWTYQGVVLREAFHLSYPLVFEHAGEIYMVPETLGAGAVRLYRAEPFPMHWVHVADLLSGTLADPTPFHFSGRWWMFGCDTPHTHDHLSLFHADHLFGPWHPHPANPIVARDNRRARPAGRVVSINGVLHRFAQDCGQRYGGAVRAFAISQLTADTYREQECPNNPVLSAAGAGWNGKGMHHVDAQQQSSSRWIAVVDGICHA
ncbi:glucosamine inositolphosphorylceramide transferase family protein [Rhizobium oryziradicis]|uniref:Glucosamine inositolphosphorylceramide transferase 1 N-terminal domain-containing protein n=1 Tax=Rhizobium oryziradicis TaxID=1867956 RepID=A0A1Q8ZVR0_9HYPH|nr:hypothetical protein [Rhizobium oryziradicis]OLP46164.1 hypothetical protein BJF95_03140 [Rhizobium oryziradicis]